MDQFVRAVKDTKEKDLKQLKKEIETKLTSLIQLKGTQFAQSYSQLDPAKHTLGLVYLLFIKGSQSADSEFASLFENFVQGYSPAQVRNMCAERFGGVLRYYAAHLQNIGQPERGIEYMDRVMATLPTKPSIISPAHQIYIQLCLSAKMYRLAARRLEVTILAVEPKETGVNPSDYMQYYYYGAMVYIGLKEYEKAMDFLLQVVSIPARDFSAIMLEAYKKVVLVSLLLTGKAPASLPKEVSQHTSRSLQFMGSNYLELASACESNNIERIQKVYAENAEVLRRDHNEGLVMAVLARGQKQTITNLTATYLTLSLKDIATSAGLSGAGEAESMLMEMVAAGELKARINQKDGMVEFSEAKRGVGTQEDVQKLHKEIETVQTLVGEVERTHSDILVSAEYVKKEMMKDSSRMFPERRGGKGAFSRMRDILPGMGGAMGPMGGFSH